MKYSTNEEKLRYKHRLQELCIAKLNERVAAAREAMNEAQESANSEEKSSAGDKYEVGRAMSQIDRDRNAQRLEEALQELLLLESIATDTICTEANNGAIVSCGDKSYFILCGLGMLDYEGEKVAVVSPLSPFANAVRDKKKGEHLHFHDQDLHITEVF